jgi:hypothetical protein
MSIPPTDSSALTSFLKQMESLPGELELLFIQRAKRKGDVWSGQVKEKNAVMIDVKVLIPPLVI